MQNMLAQIANKLFELFVVNPDVAAIQSSDGKYYTKYFSYNADVLRKMLEKDGSLGCYQQGYRNGLVRWICLDYDCVNKEEADIDWLFLHAVKPCTKYLDEVGIRYLTEYSGRRGIHVWIVFDSLLKKRQAFGIVESILKHVEYSEEDKAGFVIDRFPATASASGNKVGKQVKIPLSVHKRGNRSFFFDEKLDFKFVQQEDFWQHQLNILNSYVMNDPVECMDKLQVQESIVEKACWKYHSYEVVQGVECTAEEVISILSETVVYRNIFYRLRSGRKETRDWFVLLGTLKYLDNSEQLINEIFSISPHYQVELTRKQVLQWKDHYYPATFEYLYDIYQLDIEPELDPSMTGLVYLLKRLSASEQFIELQEIYHVNETITFGSADAIRLKELSYIRENDEVVPIAYWNRLNYLTGYDLNKLERLILEIRAGNCNSLEVCEAAVYDRKEQDKVRRLVSLGAEERILTTWLAMILAYSLKKEWKSYSYNVMFTSKTDIFYNWYVSWENFIDSVKPYLEVPYFEDYGLMELDLKSFYDNVDFLAVYQLMEGQLSEENRNIARCLIDYNDKLMRYISGGRRIGLPQGPAYARIIAEYFLNTVMEHLEEKCPELQKGEYRFSRYVDDMFLVYDENIDGDKLFVQMKCLIEKYGLHLNVEKSINRGRIGDIREAARKEILRKDKVHYEFREDDYNWSLSIAGKNRRFLNSAFAKEYHIEDVVYVFGSKRNLIYQQMYYKRYAANIFAESGGRGSAFIRFYTFLFQNTLYLQDAVEKDLFHRIPLNTLNFKNCVSQMYLGKQAGVLNLEETGLRELLMRWSEQDINTEEACIIRALLYEDEQENR